MKEKTRTIFLIKRNITVEDPFREQIRLFQKPETWKPKQKVYLNTRIKFTNDSSKTFQIRGIVYGLIGEKIVEKRGSRISKRGKSGIC